MSLMKVQPHRALRRQLQLRQAYASLSPFRSAIAASLSQNQVCSTSRATRAIASLILEKDRGATDQAEKMPHRARQKGVRFCARLCGKIEDVSKPTPHIRRTVDLQPTGKLAIIPLTAGCAARNPRRWIAVADLP
jgi:hypothetical protein